MSEVSQDKIEGKKRRVTIKSVSEANPTNASTSPKKLQQRVHSYRIKGAGSRTIWSEVSQNKSKCKKKKVTIKSVSEANFNKPKEMEQRVHRFRIKGTKSER
jgi:hypothetical protein